MEKKQKEIKITELRQERDVYKKQFLKMRSNYENKIKELSILKELGNTLRSSRVYEKTTLLERQLEIVEKYSSLSAIFLLLLDDTEDCLHCIAKSHDNSPEILTFFIEDDKSPAWKAISSQQVLIVKATDLDYTPPSIRSSSHGAYLFLPLLDKSRTIGVCILHDKNENSFDANQIRFLSLVSDHMVTTILISRFYKQMRNEEKQRVLLSRFFSKTIIEKIFSSKDNIRLGGERREITVLFADLTGFTALSENIEQEKVVEILNGFFSRITPIIFRHHGTLDKFMGDGLLAFFGAPISSGDDPILAVQTAIEIIREITDINKQSQKNKWPILHVSIGINTGDVVAGYIGSEDHLNYTVIGDAVNVAQRIETIAGYDTILISEAVRNKIIDKTNEIQGLQALTPLSPQKLKGKEKHIPLYRVETTL